MDVREAYRMAYDALDEAGVSSPDVDAWWLLAAATDLLRSEVVLAQERRLDEREERTFRAMLARRVAREPLQHIVGRTEFYGLELAVDARALVPRPETERLVEIALECLQGIASPRVLDVGTGSGAIALAILAERPGAEVMATDTSVAALEIAQENAERLGFPMAFRSSDLLRDPDVRAFAATATAIVSNLPYLPDADRAGAEPEVDRDPPDALYGGPSGLEIVARLVDEAQPLLPKGSWALFELDPRNIDAAAGLARDWSTAEIEEDLAGRRRFLVLRR